MDYILGLLLSAILIYKYWALFIFVFLSAMALPLPSNTLLLAVGAFAGQGYFDFPAALAIGILANVAGDSADYFLVRRFGGKIFRKHQDSARFDSLKRYIKLHAGLTILITRMTTTFNVIVNVLSGLIPIKFGKFLAYDVAGNALDVLIMLGCGYLFGVYWENFADLFGWLGLLIAAGIGAYFFLRFYDVRRKKLSR